MLKRRLFFDADSRQDAGVHTALIKLTSLIGKPERCTLSHLALITAAAQMRLGAMD